MTDPRMSFDDFFLQLARTYSTRADCTRRRVGAVIVNADNRAVGLGYNGAEPGEPGCLSASACPRGQHYPVVNTRSTSLQDFRICACGSSWPCEYSVAPGSSYEPGSKGFCIGIHSEDNAKRDAEGKGISIAGLRMFCTDEPCYKCVKLLSDAGLASIKWPDGEMVFSG